MSEQKIGVKSWQYYKSVKCWVCIINSIIKIVNLFLMILYKLSMDFMVCQCFQIIKNNISISEYPKLCKSIKIRSENSLKEK